MPSTILTLRLTVLQSNLQDVKDVLDLAKRRSQEIENLKNLLFGPGGVRALAEGVEGDIKGSLARLDKDELRKHERYGRGIDDLQIAQKGALEVLTELDNCQNRIDALLGARVELGSRRIHERLPARAQESILEVQSLLEDSTSLDGRWAAEARLTLQSEPLFAEYVDLLRGLALRETGIERGICELADRLLEGCDRGSPAPWASVAIPSYRGPSELTPAQIVRLGFPEWTVWALPLAAHEFGRIVASQNPTLSKGLAADAAECGEPVEVLTCALADAFATYAVGPAYACAAIFMRLDPRPRVPGGGRAVDGARAQMIFEMLRLAEATGSLAVSLIPVLETLEKAWDEALAETGAARTKIPAITKVAATFWKWAERERFTAKYHLDAWQKATMLKTVLPKRINKEPLSADEDAILAAGIGDVRDMLNAAWLCRLQYSLVPEVIAQQAQALWQETQARPQKGTRLAAAPQRVGRLS